jgi:hypothetical protein
MRRAVLLCALTGCQFLEPDGSPCEQLQRQRANFLGERQHAEQRLLTASPSEATELRAGLQRNDAAIRLVEGALVRRCR